MHWGRAVRRLRLARGLTQAELAERAGWLQPAVAKVESRATLTTATLETVAAALEVSCELLAREVEFAEGPEREEHYNATDHDDREGPEDDDA